jgi:bifunctional non-homologous end joining protein LigD
MRLTPTAELPTGPWGYEVKFDGYRMMATIDVGRVALITRNDHNFTSRFPAIAEQLPAAVGDHAAVLDGEMIGFRDGKEHRDELKTSFPNAAYYVFDLLELDGEAVIRRPLAERREQLNDIFIPQERIRLSTMYYDPVGILAAARERGHEGVVAKNLGSTYRPGKRSRDWRKLKF